MVRPNAIRETSERKHTARMCRSSRIPCGWFVEPLLDLSRGLVHCPGIEVEMLCRPADKPGMRGLFSAGAGSAPIHRQSQGIFCQGEELAQFSDGMLNARRK